MGKTIRASLYCGAVDIVIAAKKSGYKDWERKIKTTAGAINLTPELEKAQ